MKTKTNTVLAVLALLAYWFGLCNVSAFYDPGAQRWLNRDPLADKVNVVHLTDKMSTHPPELSFAQVLNISIEEFENVNVNMSRFTANDPCSKVDPYGLDWLDCMAKCIEKNDPSSSKCKTGLSVLGGTLPYRWVRPIFGPKLGTPLTTVPSIGGRIIGGSGEGVLRGIGRFFSPFWVGHGLGMAGIEAACAAQCASDSKSFDW